MNLYILAEAVAPLQLLRFIILYFVLSLSTAISAFLFQHMPYAAFSF